MNNNKYLPPERQSKKLFGFIFYIFKSYFNSGKYSQKYFAAFKLSGESLRNPLIVSKSLNFS